MRTINIPFPDITYMEKTRLVAKVAKDTLILKGSSTLYVRNPTGISIGDFLVLEAFESDNAEIVQVTYVDAAYHTIDLATPTLLDHLSGVVIISIPFDMVKVYIGTSADITTHTDLVTNLLRPDNAYTYIIDQTGTSLDYYSYRYFNSQTGSIGSHILYIACAYDAVLTVDNLKRWFMFGLDLTDDDGYPFPMSMFEFAIRVAVDNLEKVLQIRLKPTSILDERQDYFRQDYLDFAFIQLNEWPVISLERISLKYPTAQTEIAFPLEWAQLRKNRGQVHLIPTTGSLSQIMIGTGGDYLNFVWRGMDFMPDLWRLDYTAGFAEGMCPNDIVGIVGKMACFYPLAVAGDLVGGIAIASKSIGIDGLSQSINTTSSPENAGYCLMSSNIHTDSGLIKIEDLAGKSVNVLSLKDSKFSFYPASKIWKTRDSAKVWKIEFSNDQSLLATKNHPIMNSNGKYISVEGLKIGSEVKTKDGICLITKIIPNFTIGDVFDIEVPKSHNFVANGIVVHNSARLRQYEKELKIELPRLIQFYKSFRMVSC